MAMAMAQPWSRVPYSQCTAVKLRLRTIECTI